jgi:type I restriction enzyme S subunit
VINRDSIGHHWPVHPLGKICEFLDHQRRPVTESDRVAGPYPYYGANGQQGTINQFIFDEPLVLLAEDGGHFGDPNRSIAYRIDGKTWVNNHAHVLRAKKGLSLPYLCRVLEHYDVTPFVTGTTRGKLTKGGASRIPIPVPPMEEQQRIAAILDQAGELRAKRRQALAKLDTLPQSLFLEMFGDVRAKSVEMRPLQSLIRENDGINYGVVQPGGDYPGGRPLIRVGDFSEGIIRPDEVKYIDPQIESTYKRSRLKGDEVLVSCVGSIGTVALCDRSVSGFNIARAVARVPLDAKRIDAIYLLHYLKTDLVQDYFKAQLRTVNQPTLNIKQITETPVYVPSEILQQKFAERIDQLKNVSSKNIGALQASQKMFESLQHLAFRGEL